MKFGIIQGALRALQGRITQEIGTHPEGSRQAVCLAAQREGIGAALGVLAALRIEHRPGARVGPLFVVLPGPNPPEVVSLRQLGAVYDELDGEQCTVYRVDESGRHLEELHQSAAMVSADDQFRYWVTELVTHDGEVVAATNWSRRLRD